MYKNISIVLDDSASITTLSTHVFSAASGQGRVRQSVFGRVSRQPLDKVADVLTLLSASRHAYLSQLFGADLRAQGTIRCEPTR